MNGSDEEFVDFRLKDATDVILGLPRARTVNQGTLTKGKGSVQFTSPLRQLVFQNGT
jgi:hypothetical protein